jgi:hypothetical protein
MTNPASIILLGATVINASLWEIISAQPGARQKKWALFQELRRQPIPRLSRAFASPAGTRPKPFKHVHPIVFSDR